MKETQDRIKMTGYVGPSRKQLEEQGFEVVSLVLIGQADSDPLFELAPGHATEPDLIGADADGWFGAFRKIFQD